MDFWWLILPHGVLEGSRHLHRLGLYPDLVVA